MMKSGQPSLRTMAAVIHGLKGAIRSKSLSSSYSLNEALQHLACAEVALMRLDLELTFGCVKDDAMDDPHQ